MNKLQKQIYITPIYPASIRLMKGRNHLLNNKRYNINLRFKQGSKANKGNKTFYNYAILRILCILYTILF